MLKTPLISELDGYLNESGTINTKRLQVILDEMAEWEREIFEKEYADMNWYKGKQAKHVKEMESARKRSKFGTFSFANSSRMEPAYACFAVLTKPQREIFDKVKEFVLEHRSPSSAAHAKRARLTMPNLFPARERQFINKLADDLHLSLTWDEYDEDDQNLVTWRFPGELEEPLPEPESNGKKGEDVEAEVEAEAEADGEDEDEWEDEDDEESRAAVDRVLAKYEKAKVVEDDKEGDFDARYEMSVKEKMDEWKRNYYKVCWSLNSARWMSLAHHGQPGLKGKLEISYDDPEEMHALVYRYIEGMQWVMHYYYSGVASWSWFYNYHYAPRISGMSLPSHHPILQC